MLRRRRAMAIGRIELAARWAEPPASRRPSRYRPGLGTVTSHPRARSASAKPPVWNDRRKRLLWARVAAEPTVAWHIVRRWRSCVISRYRWRSDWPVALEYVDDDHRRAAMPADEGRRGRTGHPSVASGLDRRDVQQGAHLRQILAA